MNGIDDIGTAILALDADAEITRLRAERTHISGKLTQQDKKKQN